MPKSVSNKKKALLLGVGLDSDGHKRVTTGENFAGSSTFSVDGREWGF